MPHQASQTREPQINTHKKKILTEDKRPIGSKGRKRTNSKSKTTKITDNKKKSKLNLELVPLKNQNPLSKAVTGRVGAEKNKNEITKRIKDKINPTPHIRKRLNICLTPFLSKRNVRKTPKNKPKPAGRKPAMQIHHGPIKSTHITLLLAMKQMK